MAGADLVVAVWGEVEEEVDLCCWLDWKVEEFCKPGQPQDGNKSRSTKHDVSMYQHRKMPSEEFGPHQSYELLNPWSFDNLERATKCYEPTAIDKLSMHSVIFSFLFTDNVRYTEPALNLLR